MHYNGFWSLSNLGVVHTDAFRDHKGKRWRLTALLYKKLNHAQCLHHWISSKETVPGAFYITAVKKARVHSTVAIHCCLNLRVLLPHGCDVKMLWHLIHECTSTLRRALSSDISAVRPSCFLHRNHQAAFMTFYTSTCLYEFISRVINSHLHSSCSNICLSLVKFKEGKHRSGLKGERLLTKVNCLSMFDSGEQKWSAARSNKSPPPTLCFVLCCAFFLSKIHDK